MQLSNDELKKILVDPGHISLDDFEDATEEASEEEATVGDIVLSRGLITEPQYIQLLADYVHTPYVDLERVDISDENLQKVPELMARNFGIILFKIDERGAHVAFRDPLNIQIIQVLEKRLGHPVVPYFASAKQVESVLARYGSRLGEEFAKVFSKLKELSSESEERDKLVVRIADMLLQYGDQSGASDIHLEPTARLVRVRFRIDGVMHDMLSVPKNYYDLVLTRLKILAKMRTDEHRSAQDGKLRFRNASGDTVDVRVSIVPVTEGENVVMRLLSGGSQALSLSELGMSSRDFDRVQRAISNPHGMILVTGPTGSGKTTTAYSVLKILNRSDVHIATIEDPVEYDIDGVTQIQVNKRTNLTFAEGLRALVRQDPDIILVGEVRDTETARIAINSAMTGHLVLSTLHANNSATTLPRLLDMGVEPFLVASTVNVVVAQRLTRRICQHCRASYKPSDDEIAAIKADKAVLDMVKKVTRKKPDELLLFKGMGCNICGDTGYNGRSGIFEVLLMDNDIKKLLLDRASADDIQAAAVKNGMTSMLEDGIEKVVTGVTTISEVLRVTKG